MARKEWDAEWPSYGSQLSYDLHALRKLRGFTQEQLAELSGISRNQVSNLERNENSSGRTADPALSTVYRLAWALEVPPVVLLPRADRPVVPICAMSRTLEIDVHWPEAPSDRDTLSGVEERLRHRAAKGSVRLPSKSHSGSG